MKKIFITSAIIVLVLAIIIGIVSLVKEKPITFELPDDEISQSVPCASEGETIGSQGMPFTCCSGLKPVGGPGGYTGVCPPPPGGLSTCSNCGDGVCNSNTEENKCNCAEDCK